MLRHVHGSTFFSIQIRVKRFLISLGLFNPIHVCVNKQALFGETLIRKDVQPYLTMFRCISQFLFHQWTTKQIRNHYTCICSQNVFLSLECVPYYVFIRIGILESWIRDPIVLHIALNGTLRRPNVLILFYGIFPVLEPYNV